MNKITKEFLESEIISVEYNRLQGTLTHCAITVKSGFVFTGESACVDPNNFDKEIGEQVAYDSAFEKMWMPYGFWLHQKVRDEAPAVKNDLGGVLVISENERMDFGKAVHAMKAGIRVCRSGWNGKGMWLGLVHPDDDDIVPPRPTYAVAGIAGYATNGCLPWIGMKTADNKFVPWLASQTDVLAEDWQIAG